ncbi:tetratricopeptide repeat protein [Luteolibacter sp. GHJ8]|jgi:tetratricopeptide (TPR) repeat protein|uniref:Tetratricopeptide repeat protein n=1 Tax=Luteolibacter rhizosphaerae TaxID=2989719 RepID=A0ABT3FXM3_9BACT|nr:tetratricopeptide repeat protein [Luteolibacter rhizosphaerae]MCW1912182.1 tetratricopeptide repeat protein [Luteolibacter rhizosphaerae]
MIKRLISFFAGDRSARGGVLVTSDQEHDEVFKRATDLISPLTKMHGRQDSFPEGRRQSLFSGIADLHAVTAYNPQNWAAFWFKGKAYQALGNKDAAKREFQASFALEKQNPDVAREYGISCSELGLVDEAVLAAKHALELKPEDAGLKANLALALLLAGKISDAKETIAESLKASPYDPISKSVERVIGEVISGKRKQPRFVADLERSC